MNKTKVMLIFPPFSQPKNSKKRCLVPLGLAYIGAYLEEKGIQVKILDSVVEGYNTDLIKNDTRTFGLSLEEIAGEIQEFAPEVLGVSCLMTQQRNNAFAICQIAKNLDPSIFTIMGGAHPSALPDEVLKNENVDAVVVGEGEKAMLDAIKVCSPGIYRSKLLNIDTIPWPARELLPLEKYLKINMPENIFSPNKRVTQILTSRGCPFHCVFCATTNIHGSWRGRNAEDVIAEARYLKEWYDIDELNIVDENFILYRNRTVEILTGLKELGIAWSNPGGIWINGLDFELLDLMKSSGCYQLTFPVESSNPHILKEIIHKPLNLDKVKPLARYCQKIGIDTHAFFISGFPEQNQKDLFKDYKFALDCKFTSATFNILSAFPGSELYEQYKDQINIDNLNYTKVSIKHPTIKRRELERMVKNLNRDFNRSIIWRNPLRFLKKYLGTILRKRKFWNILKIFDRT